MKVFKVGNGVMLTLTEMEAHHLVHMLRDNLMTMDGHHDFRVKLLDTLDTIAAQPPIEKIIPGKTDPHENPSE